jgi:hypothetical protein
MNTRWALAVLLLCGSAARSLGDEAQAARAIAFGETFMKLVDALDVVRAVDWTDSPDSLLHKSGVNSKNGQKTDQDALKKGFREFLESGGPLHGHVLAREQDLGGRFIKLDYLALGERKPLYIELVFYRPDNDWKLYSWGWYGDPRELFGPRPQNK